MDEIIPWHRNVGGFAKQRQKRKYIIRINLSKCGHDGIYWYSIMSKTVKPGWLVQLLDNFRASFCCSCLFIYYCHLLYIYILTGSSTSTWLFFSFSCFEGIWCWRNAIHSVASQIHIPSIPNHATLPTHQIFLFSLMSPYLIFLPNTLSLYIDTFIRLMLRFGPVDI